MNRLNKSGFSLVELVFIVAVVGLISTLGYTFYSRQQVANETTNNAQAARTADVPTAPRITTTDDLTSAVKTLDATTVGDDSDNAQLDTELNAF